MSESTATPEESWTVQRIIQWMSADFERRGIESPRLDAEVLVGHALGLPRLQLFLDLQRPLAPTELAEIRALVQRRRRREPVAYIVGKRAFYKHEFVVDAAVLIPRPDTETLVEAALAFLRGSTGAVSAVTEEPSGSVIAEPPVVPAGLESELVLDEAPLNRADGESHLEPIAEEPEVEVVSQSHAVPAASSRLAEEVGADVPRILDLCTGSGCVGLSIAAELPGAELVLSDISAAALAIAGRNASAILDREVELMEADLFAGVVGRRFELITINPPYITTREMNRLAPEIREHEPSLALEAGAEGFDLHRRIVAEVAAYLAEGGAVMVEVGAGQAPRLAEAFGRAGFSTVRTHRDLGGIERVVEARA